MKNKIFFIIFVLCFFSLNLSYSKIIKFESPEIEIKNDGKKITAKNGVIIESDDGIIINADKATFDKEKNILKFLDNIKVKDNLNSINFTTDELIYEKNKDLFKIIGKSRTNIKEKYFIDSKNIFYDRFKMEIFSKDLIQLQSILGTKISGKEFKFLINDNIVRGKNLEILDKDKNQYLLKNGIVNLDTEEFVGKDIQINFEKSLFGNNENDPRFVGRALNNNKEQSNIYKGAFTTCKKRKNQDCPAWAIYADEIEHQKDKQIINYKNAWLKIYDVPVVYFPKFYHPDPSVKRQSGFLFPTINSSSLNGQSLQIPYYKVISDNKDLTLSPRLYFDDNILIQTEYRQANKNSNFISDFSYNKNNNTKSHFFSNFQGKLKNNYNFEINVEKVTNDKYLKINAIESPIITNQSKLYSYLSFQNNNDDYFLNASLGAYEDLGKSKDDRYEYIYPEFNFYKDFGGINKNSKGNFIFTSDGYNKNYNTNVSENVLINDILYESNLDFFGNGFTKNYKLLLRNINSNAKNSNNYKNDSNFNLLSTFIFETKYPLFKKTEKFDNIFIPKLSLRFSPNETKNSTEKNARLTTNNIFDIDRSGQNDLVETGQSVTLGFDYEKINKFNNSSFLNFSTGVVLRDKNNFDLPNETSLGKKTSDLVGLLEFNPSKFFKFNYNFSIDNNLTQFNFNNITTSFTVNNLVTSFEFLEENKYYGETSYLKNKTEYKVDENKSILFETSQNLKTDLSEYYKLIYQYQNDCLIASIEYDKEYYSDGELKPREDIMFLIKLKTFGDLARIPVINN
tara:strand:- start:385 stop:2766 length:2382 start_codon:yes stop_codon:yes gene_type:complete